MNETISTTRQQILRELKVRGGASQAQLAQALELTREAVRQHLAQLEQQGWVRSAPRATGGRGRPTHRYTLTAIAEEQFP
ncbi:MAG TPA: winged helix-turn-helix transcriptional regulator, partial [Gammaproteobacteria bacterium]